MHDIHSSTMSYYYPKECFFQIWKEPDKYFLSYHADRDNEQAKRLKMLKNRPKFKFRNVVKNITYAK